MQAEQHFSKTQAAQTSSDSGAQPVGQDDQAPWSAEQVRQWRARNPVVSPWRVVGVQALVALLAYAVAAGLFGARSAQALSLAYGAGAAWLPAALFARVMARRMRMQTHAASALVALMMWEGIKIALTVALLLAAPRLVVQLNWLALLVGFVVTIKAAWVALWWVASRRRPSVN